MKKYIPIGTEFYKKLIDEGFYYVDKTLLIKDIVDNHAAVTLITRPRRFGKTLAMTMLQAYFEDERDKTGTHLDNSRYFDGMKIRGCDEIYLKMQEQYPVISLSLKSAKQPNYDMAYEMIVNEVRGEFKRHYYVCDDECLFPDEIKLFNQIIDGTAKKSDYATSLKFLSQCLKKYHNRNVVVLIDEYDVPLENAYLNGFYDEMAAFIRTLFESALKTNENLEFSVITGCLRISRESIFTGLNNFEINTILSERYADCCGFNESEVNKLLSDYELTDCIDEMQQWYDGYIFGNTEIYNPWSVLNYVKAKCLNKSNNPEPYWSNTSSNSIIRELVENADMSVRENIESLIAGNAIEKPVHEDITYEDIHDTQDNLWNFLFFTGYLKQIGIRRNGLNNYVKMAIPNAEIRYIYENSITAWFDKRIKSLDRTLFYKSLISGDAAAVENILITELTKSISYFDEKEQFYHGFMLGMLTGLGNYRVKSNRETGDGRADISMESTDISEPVVIIEFKYTDNITDLDRYCDEALDQIANMHYDAEYRVQGYSNFLKYGICFFKKSCRVKCIIEV